MILGYDNRDVNKAVGETLAEKLEYCYLDTSVPFGHAGFKIKGLSLAKVQD